MTNREFYNAVIANTITEDVIAHASEALVKLDERNAKRASKPSAKQKENEASAANGAWRKHTEIERGNPVRTYEGEKFRRR